MSENKTKKEKPSKKVYQKPEILSEELNVYGAACNGTSSGGRKASVASPAFCNSRKLNS